jgi:hypothetical protein
MGRQVPPIVQNAAKFFLRTASVVKTGVNGWRGGTFRIVATFSLSPPILSSFDDGPY